MAVAIVQYTFHVIPSNESEEDYRSMTTDNTPRKAQSPSVRLAVNLLRSCRTTVFRTNFTTHNTLPWPDVVHSTVVVV